MSWEYAAIIGVLGLLNGMDKSDAKTQAIFNQNRILSGIEAVHHAQALIENVFIPLLPLTQEDLKNLTLYITSVAQHASAQRQYNALFAVMEERLYRLVPICRDRRNLKEFDSNTFVLEKLFRDPEIHLLIPDDDTGSLVVPPTRDLLSYEERYRLEGHIQTAEELIQWCESERMKTPEIEKHIEDPWQDALLKISKFSEAIAEAETKILPLVFDWRACDKAALGERQADIEKQIASHRKGVSKLWWDDEYRRDRREDNPFSIISSFAVCSDLDDKHWSRIKSHRHKWNFMRAFSIEVVYKSLRLLGSCADGLESRQLELENATKTLMDGGISPEIIRELNDRIRMLYCSIAIPEYFATRLELRDSLKVGAFPAKNITTPLRTPAELSVDHVLSEAGQLLETQTRDWLKQTVVSLLAKANTTNKGEPDA